LADETEKAGTSSPEPQPTANAATETSPESSSPEAAGDSPAPAKPSPADSRAADKSGGDSETTPAGSRPAHTHVQKDRNLFIAFLETMKHIEKCEKDRTVIFRHSDRTSVICLITAFAIEVFLMILYLAQVAYRPVCIALALVADLSFGLAILWYVLLRFGVIRSFEPRQTLLTWQLMIGAGALFAFSTMNVAFAFFIFYNMSIGMSAPPPL
jgi:hypothetical protein